MGLRQFLSWSRCGAGKARSASNLNVVLKLVGQPLVYPPYTTLKWDDSLMAVFDMKVYSTLQGHDKMQLLAGKTIVKSLLRLLAHALTLLGILVCCQVRSTGLAVAFHLLAGAPVVLVATTHVSSCELFAGILSQLKFSPQFSITISHVAYACLGGFVVLVNTPILIITSFSTLLSSSECSLFLLGKRRVAMNFAGRRN
jgi:hypothetical protein